MKKRNRGSIALSEEGARVVRAEVYGRGWSQYQWSALALTSVSTVKRLLAGKAVDPTCFYALLRAVRLEVKDGFILKKDECVKSHLSQSREIPLSSNSPGVFMTAQFTEDNRPQVERAIRHLQKLLTNCEVTFASNKGAVVVSGDFSEDDKEHIEMTITQLEKQFTSCKVTW